MVESFTILDIDPFYYGFGGTIDNRRTEKRSDGIYYVWDKTPGAKYYEVTLAILTRVDRWKYDSYSIRNDLINENEILISGDDFNIFDYIDNSDSGHDGFAKILIRPVFVTNEGKEVFGERVIEYFFDDDVSINHNDIIRADNFSSLKSTFSDDLGESIHFEEDSKGVRIVWGKNTRLQYNLNELSSDCVVKLVVYKGTRVLFSSTLEDLSKPGSMDISSWVIENGTGRYRTLAFACYKSKDGEEKEVPLGSFRNSYLIDFSNYLYFTSNTPKLNRDIDVKTGDKYTITYSVAELPKWFTINGVKLSSPYVHIQKSGDRRPTNYVPTEVSPGKWSVEVNTTGMAGEYKVWYDVFLKIGDEFYGDTLEGTFTQSVFGGILNLDALFIIVSEPDIGEHPDYTIYDLIGEDEFYTLELELQEQVNVADWRTMSSSSVFRSGVTYRTKIKVIPKGNYRVTFENAHIFEDGHIDEEENISCSYLPGNITAYYVEMMPEDTYYDIYIGTTRVSATNRLDVLNDGGSVQYLLKGECTDKHLINQDVLILNNMHLGGAQYHGGADESRAAIAIYDDVPIKLIGNNTISTDIGEVNGIYFDEDNYNSFWGNGKLSINVSHDSGKAIYAPGCNISLYDSVRLNVYGHYGLWSNYCHEVGYLNIYDNASFYAYGYRADDDTEGLAVTVPYIDMNDNSYFYAEYEWNQPAIDTWGTVFQISSIQNELTIKGIKNILGIVNREWTTLESINEGSGKPHESEYRALSVQSGVPQVATGIKLDKTSIEFDSENRSYILTSTITPSIVNETITWTSSNDSVVLVQPQEDGKAIIYAQKNGTATITATLSNGLKATCMVTVNAKAEEPPIEVDTGKGDINIDTKVNAADCNLMKKIILGQYSTTAKQWWAADINDDNKVNAADLSMLIKLIVK